MSSAETLPPELRSALLDVARASIAEGTRSGEAATVDVDAYPEALQEPRGCFVTLRNPDGSLRGCVGALEPRVALVAEVARSAFRAGFRDPRCAPLHVEELAGLHVHISVLSLPRPMPVRSEADLVQQLVPGADGVTLREGSRVGTFLPAVWESLPDPKRFVTQLKLKAGMPEDYWSSDIRVERYRAESFD